ncbi:ATPase component [Pseudomonas syringae pv. actinidiae]|uniref:ATPase component n=1 Tax=Pseudomonas syringae pv. actinidiae TaxID=103796 RepID=A0A2V0Q7B0_PSESF|nr:ATPase component [Pseudomonas syringae pv. actinidiae]
MAVLTSSAATYPDRLFIEFVYTLAGVQQQLTLLCRDLNIPLAVAIIQQACYLAGLLGDQGANKAANAQMQVVILLPSGMSDFHLFLLMIDIAQYAQLIVQAGEYRP